VFLSHNSLHPIISLAPLPPFHSCLLGVNILVGPKDSGPACDGGQLAGPPLRTQVSGTSTDILRVLRYYPAQWLEGFVSTGCLILSIHR
jgi:hypothetical protein